VGQEGFRRGDLGLGIHGVVLGVPI
jgi:hypothetical protein